MKIGALIFFLDLIRVVVNDDYGLWTLGMCLFECSHRCPAWGVHTVRTLITTVLYSIRLQTMN
jgi:hypothetical protein